MSDDIYCGSGKIPAGKREGTMKECLKKNQVRLWGVKKIDKKVLENKNLLNPEKEYLKLKEYEIVLKALKKRANKLKAIDSERGKDKREKEIEKLRKKYKKYHTKWTEQKENYKKSKELNIN